MLKFTDFFDGKIEEPVEVDPHSGEPLDERVLSVQDRMKLSRRMKRFQHRIQRKRKIQMRRKADAGRLQKRAQENQVSNLIQGIENMTGKTFPADFKSKSIEGSSEIDLVRSGLEDTMLETYKVISDVWNKHSEIPDLRTAAMIVAVRRIAQSYGSLGI